MPVSKDKQALLHRFELCCQACLLVSEPRSLRLDPLKSRQLQQGTKTITLALGTATTKAGRASQSVVTKATTVHRSIGGVNCRQHLNRSACGDPNTSDPLLRATLPTCELNCEPVLRNDQFQSPWGRQNPKECYHEPCDDKCGQIAIIASQLGRIWKGCKTCIAKRKKVSMLGKVR